VHYHHKARHKDEWSETGGSETNPHIYGLLISKTTQGRKVFSTHGASRTRYSHAKRRNWITTWFHEQKLTQLNHTPECAAETIQFLEYVVIYPHDFGWGLLNATPKVQATTWKIDKFKHVLHKMLLTVWKKRLTEWGKTFSNHT
jgi:hypothetical protein